MILYTVVTAGDAMTLGPFGVFNVALGVHVYVVAFDAVKFTLVPAHILPLVVAIVGFGITVTVNTAWLVQDPAVPITVNVATSEVDVTGGVIVIGLLLKFGNAEYPTGKLHWYVLAPPAVKVVVFCEPLKFCEHNVLFPTMVTVGSVITDTWIVAKFVHVACDPMIE